jgi:hypothetical protein
VVVAGMIAVSGWSQSPKFLFPYAGSVFGGVNRQNVVACGDLNGDSVPDFAIGLPYVYAPLAGVNLGQVDIRSGADGSILTSIAGTTPYEYLGLYMASIGDVDGDGLGDLAASTNLSTVKIIHGGTWSVSTFATAYVPSLLAGAGDVDGDGTPDLAIGKRGAVSSPPACVWTAGDLTILSGATGAAIRSHAGASGEYWPASFVAPGDMDSDGRSDYVVAGAGLFPGTGSSSTCGSFPAIGSRVERRSGANGSVLWSVAFGPSDHVLLADPGDVDLNGVRDVAAKVVSHGGTPTTWNGRSIIMWNGSSGAELWSEFILGGGTTPPGGFAAAGQQDGVFGGDLITADLSWYPNPRIRCLSGFGGAVRWTLYGRGLTQYSPFGASLAGLGDLDGDGLNEFAVVAERNHTYGTPAGVYVYSGAALGVVARVPGCASVGAPPTMTVHPAAPGFPATIFGTGGPGWGNYGGIFASAPAGLGLALPPGIVGALPCMIDLDLSTAILLAGAQWDSNNPAGVRGSEIPLPLPPGFPTTDWIVPDRWSLGFDLPNTPALGGFTLRLQTLFTGPAGVSLSNSVDLTLLTL